MEVVQNIPFCILLTSISGQHVHVRKTHHNGKKILNLKQWLQTSTRDLTLSAAVITIQCDSKNRSSSKGTNIQESTEWFDSSNIPNDQATCHDDLTRMLVPFE